MLLQQAWACLLYLYGIFLDVISVCEHAHKLSPNDINREKFPSQYFGDWYFIAAAASAVTPSLEGFTVVDNTLFTINEETRPDRLLFRAAIRTNAGACVPREWIYLVANDSMDLGTEGRPNMKTELFTSKCPNCIVVQESTPDIKRLLLYSRTPQLDQECHDDFKKKAICTGMPELLVLPQAQEYCEFQAIDDSKLD